MLAILQRVPSSWFTFATAPDDAMDQQVGMHCLVTVSVFIASPSYSS